MSQTLFPAAASQDVVGVFEGYSQVFRDARPMKVSVSKGANLMEHPLEDSCTITDHMVMQPVEVSLSLTLTPDTCRETYREISDIFMQGKVLTVQTRVSSYPNMLIQSLPHDETPEMFDAVTMSLKLREVTLIRTEFTTAYNAKKTSQSKTVDRGEVQPVDVGDCWSYKKIKW